MNENPFSVVPKTSNPTGNTLQWQGWAGLQNPSSMEMFEGTWTPAGGGWNWDKMKELFPNSYQHYQNNPFTTNVNYATEIIGSPVAATRPGWYLDPRYGIPVSYDDLPEINGQRMAAGYSNHAAVGPQARGTAISGADPNSFFSSLSHMNWDRDNSGSILGDILTGAATIGGFALGMPGLTGFMGSGGSFVPGLLSGGSYSLGAGFGGSGWNSGIGLDGAAGDLVTKPGGSGMFDSIASWFNQPDMSSIMNTDWSGLGGATGAQTDPLWGAIAQSVPSSSGGSGGFLSSLMSGNWGGAASSAGNRLWNSFSQNPMRWLGAGMQTLQSIDQARARRNFANQQNVNRQGFIDALRNTYTNPQSFLEGPEYQAASRIALDALQRQDAAGGRLGNDVNRQRLMQDHAMQWLGNYRQGLSNSAGLTAPTLGDQTAGIGRQYDLINALLYENNRQARPRTSISIGANGQPMITI